MKKRGLIFDEVAEEMLKLKDEGNKISDEDILYILFKNANDGFIEGLADLNPDELLRIYMNDKDGLIRKEIKKLKNFNLIEEDVKFLELNEACEKEIQDIIDNGESYTAEKLLRIYTGNTNNEVKRAIRSLDKFKEIEEEVKFFELNEKIKNGEETLEDLVDDVENLTTEELLRIYTNDTSGRIQKAIKKHKRFKEIEGDVKFFELNK